jgi:hypothetical protein
MMSKHAMTALVLSLALGAASLPGAASGQLPSASTAPLGTANNYTALERGFTAIAVNPAGLGMPGNPGFSLTVLPVAARVGLNAFRLGDVAAFDGLKIPTSTKEAWLQSVIDEGSLAARGGFAVTELALTAGPFGLQISTVGRAKAALGPDAFELVLFGNAGRMGTARDMTLEGTRGDTWAASTAAIALGIPLPGAYGGSLALGATLKYTVGHGVGAFRDNGSVIRADPPAIDLTLPSLLPDSFTVNNGTGVGLDLGLAWEGSTWAVSAAIQNVFNTFGWNLDNLAYRPGGLLFETDTTATSFDPFPVASAPATFRDELLAQSFGTSLILGIAFHQSDRLSVTADFRHQGGAALVQGFGSHIGLGAELRLLPFLPLRGGMSRVSGGAVYFAGGVGLEFGPVHFSGSYLTEKGSAGEFRVASFALSFGHN